MDDTDILGDRLKEQLIQLWEILKLRMRNKGAAVGEDNGEHTGVAVGIKVKLQA